MAALKHNQKCRVKETATHHAGRIGYFQFYGKGPSEGVVVLSAAPTIKPRKRDKNLYKAPMTLFAVSVENCLLAR